MVEETEHEALRPAPAFCEDDPFAPMFSCRCHQPRDVAGGILSVSVHHDDGVGIHGLGDVAQPHGDGALMPQIPAKAQHVDALDGATL